MIRVLFLTVGIFSTVVLLAEVSTLGLLWSRGYLSPQAMRDIRLALSGEVVALPEEPEKTKETEKASAEEIREARIVRVLELQARENELSLLKRMTTETANRLISERQEFDEMKDGFRRELEQLQEQTISAATEQTRTVLLASPPEEAVKRLMGLTVDESADLIRGLPEKTIAKILQAFQQEPQAIQRGQELFEALYRGDPNRRLIQNTLDNLNPQPGETPNRAG